MLTLLLGYSHFPIKHNKKKEVSLKYAVIEFQKESQNFSLSQGCKGFSPTLFSKNLKFLLIYEFQKIAKTAQSHKLAAFSLTF